MINELRTNDGCTIKNMLGDCLEVMTTIPNKSVNAIVTSPPYANRRKALYGGISEEVYTDWFLPIFQQMKRVLADDGSIFINIKPHVHPKFGRSLYVMKLVLAIVEQEGMYYMDELCWTKPNPHPGYFGCRLKNAWEPIYHFTKSKFVKFYPDRESKPASPANLRRAEASTSDRKPIYRKTSLNGSGMGVSGAARVCRTTRPSNQIVAAIAPHGLKRQHPATFPVGIPRFLINTWSEEGDTILDPFAGSGTVGIACRLLKRNCILIEQNAAYYQLINDRVLIEND